MTIQRGSQNQCHSDIEAEWDCKKFYVKLQSMTGEFKFRLSFTHYTYLIRLEEDEHIFASKYKLYLPSMEELKNELESE